MKTNTHKDKGDKKYKNWNDPVAIAFDKVGRRGIQYKKPMTTSSKTNKDNYKELKEKFDNNFIPIESGYVGVSVGSKYAKLSTAKECLWSFILKEVIPMAEKRGYEKGYWKGQDDLMVKVVSGGGGGRNYE